MSFSFTPLFPCLKASLQVLKWGAKGLEKATSGQQQLASLPWPPNEPLSANLTVALSPPSLPALSPRTFLPSHLPPCGNAPLPVYSSHHQGRTQVCPVACPDHRPPGTRIHTLQVSTPTHTHTLQTTHTVHATHIPRTYNTHTYAPCIPHTQDAYYTHTPQTPHTTHTATNSRNAEYTQTHTTHAHTYSLNQASPIFLFSEGPQH